MYNYMFIMGIAATAAAAPDIINSLSWQLMNSWQLSHIAAHDAHCKQQITSTNQKRNMNMKMRW